jgi:hypothetical protein
LLVGVVVVLVAGRLVQLYRNPESPGDGFAALALIALAGIGAWIALSPEPQSCVVGVEGAEIGQTSGASCRVPFGVGAIITTGIAVYAATRWIRRRSTGSKG